MALNRGQKPRIPKGYRPIQTTYELVAKTYFDKPYKPTKAGKALKSKSKEYVQPVKIVSVKPGVMPKAGRGRRGK